MRKLLVMLLVAGSAIGLAAPAHAGPEPGPPPPGTTSYSALNASASWYFTDKPSPNEDRTTSWYLNAYQSTDGNFADLYRDVTVCRKTHGNKPSCKFSSASGSADLSTGTFTIDGKNLTIAHLEITIPLQQFDSNWNPVGAPVNTAVVADWTGTGTLEKSSGKSTYCDSTGCTKYSFKSAYRLGEADATLNGVALGESYDASLSSYSETTTFIPKP